MVYDTVDYVPGDSELTGNSCLIVSGKGEFPNLLDHIRFKSGFSSFVNSSSFGKLNTFSLSFLNKGTLKLRDGPEDVKKQLARRIALSWAEDNVFLMEMNRNAAIDEAFEDIAKIFDGPAEPVEGVNMQLVALAEVVEARFELWPLGILAACDVRISYVGSRLHKLPAGILGCGTDADIAYFLDCLTDWSDAGRHIWWPFPAVKCSMEELPVTTPVT